MRKNFYLVFMFIVVSLFKLTIVMANSCPNSITKVGVVQISTDFFTETGTCWVSIHDSTSYKTLVYRDFMFGSDGLFFVFNSYGEGPPSTKTGAREFYTFPRGDYPSFEINLKDQLVSISLTTGEIVIIDAKAMKILSMSDSEFYENPQVLPNNRGGFEIKTRTKIILDCGFRLGESPSSDPKNQCQFFDSKGQTCVFHAEDIFNYNSDGDKSIKFSDDRKLAKFLLNKCDKFDISPLIQ